MASYQRDPNKFAYSGMDIHHPPDLMPAGRCPLLFNLQPDLQSGALALRPAISLLSAVGAGAPVHSIVRLNDSIPGANQFSRFVGAGANLYSPTGQLDTGFSGNPLALVPYRPAQSPESWLYAYDSLKQRRYKTDNSTQRIGIAAPTVEPAVASVQPLYDLLDNAALAASWTAIDLVGGTAGAATQVNRVPQPGAGMSLLTSLYDSGTTGMGLFAPTLYVYGSQEFAWMAEGSMVTLDSEIVTIEQVVPGTYSTTVLSIAYDSGSTGLCTIVPAVPLPGLVRNALICLNTTSTPPNGTYARVLSVTAGPDGSYSFRCSTGAATILPGQSILGIPCFRAWTAANHLANAPVTGKSINFTFTPSTSGGSMSGIVKATPLVGNLSYAGSAVARPLQNEDYMHLSLAFDHPEWVTEVHILLDVDASTNDFTQNYYYYVMRQGDFQASNVGGSTTLQDQLNALSNAIANQLESVEEPAIGSGAPSYPAPEELQTSPPLTAQLILGSLGWTEVMFKLSDLTRVGSDQSKTLANVAKIGIQVFTSGGVVNLYFGGWWAGGGYGPDCNFNSSGNQAPPIQWRYRYRNSLTGARSTVSPETRNGEILRRQAISLTVPNSPDAQVDTVDFERRGGTNPDWHYVASVPQGGSATTYQDDVTEAAAQIGDPLEVTCYQPWPVTDMPRTGTAAVVGTSVVWASGDKFNPRWLRGTEVILGGNTYSLFAPPSSATVLQLAENVTPPGGVLTFSIPEATIEGQPLYGCWLDEANNRICGVGDPLNPGLMYFSNNDNPDGASDAGYLEIASPSEPLLNGFYAEGSNYVFTSSSLYRVESTPGAANPYAAYRLSGIEGLAGAWAFDVARKMLFYWGPDGVYAYGFGAAAENLTADSLYPLFPHAGQSGQSGIPGVPVNAVGQTIYPPNYALPNLLRIGYAESFVYATYRNSNGAVEALVYSVLSKGWRKDAYTPGATVFVLEKGVQNPTLMVGGADGNLHQVDSTATADTGGVISWVVLPPVKDVGDTRINKQWGDLVLDYETGSNTNAPALKVLWDNLLVAGPTPAVALSANRTQAVLDLISPPEYADLPVIHRNVTPLLAGTGPIFLYEWQPSFIALPEDITARPTAWQAGFTPGFKWVNGVLIHMDTYGRAKTFKVEYDNQATSITITVNHNGEQVLPYYFPPVYAHELRLVPLDDVPCHDWGDEVWIGNAEPEYGGALAVNWTDGGTPHYKFVQGIRLHADTYGQAKRIQIQYEGGIVGPTLTINHNGEETLPYSWLAPFKAHLMRIVPLDDVPWRYWPDSQWVYEIEPEPANYWISQPTSLGQAGYLHARESWIAFAGTQGGVVSAIVDGGTSVAIANLPAAFTPVKQYFVCPPLKGRYWQLTASGTGLQLYERDIEFLVKSWGSAGPYQRVKPFGDIGGGGGASGARI
jgi:hypothetical protein